MSEARALTAAAAVALLLAAGVPVQAPSGNPVENDAGSHTDAPPSYPGLLLGPGTYVGNVTGEIDHQDGYRFHPPPATVVRVRLEPAPGNRNTLDVLLASRYGSEDRWTQNTTRNLSLVSGQGEPVTLDVYYSGYSTPLETHQQRYTFNVTFERHDHARALRAGGDNASAWSVDVPGDGFARFDVTWDPGDHSRAMPGDETEVQHILLGGHPSAEDGCRSWSWLGDRHPSGEGLTGRPGFDGDDAVWGHGLPVDVPDQPDVPFPWRLWPERLGIAFTDVVEDPSGNLSMDIGVAHNNANGHIAWLVWDGPADRATIEERPAEVDFWTLEDFDEGGGQGFGVGPYAQADNLTKLGRLPAGDNVTRFVHVNAMTPAITDRETGREETQMTVTAPNGSRTRLVDDHRHWQPLGDDSPFLGISEAGPGEWRYHVEHSDGTEGDRIVVTQGSFGIPDECPGDDEMW